MTQQPTRKALFWRGEDPDITAASKLPGWGPFHRACGKQGLFFDRIARIGKSARFEVTTIRLEPYHGQAETRSYPVSTGEGEGVLPACIDALEKAAASGFPVDPANARLLTEGSPRRTFPGAPVAAEDDDFEGLLGGPAVEPDDDFEGLLG